MSLHNVFPTIKLDSSPHNRPLSPRNLADYRTLVGWLFENPHALDKYTSEFVTGQQSHDKPTADSNQQASTPPDREQQSCWSLLLMVAILLAVIFGVVGIGVQLFAGQFPIARADLITNLLISALLGELMLVLVFTIIGWWLDRPATGVLLGFFLGLTLSGLQFYQLSFMVPTVDGYSWFGSSLSGFNLLTGAGAGLMLNNLIGVVRRSHYGAFVEMVTKWMMGITITLFIVVYNAGFSVGSAVDQSLWNTLVGIGAFLAGLIRPLDWLRGTMFFQHNPATSSNWDAPRVTLLPTDNIHRSLKFWLERNWDRGLRNANQLWQHTNQRGPVLRAICAELRRLETEQKGKIDLAERVAGLLDPSKNYGWTLDDLLESHLILPNLTRASLKDWWTNVRKQTLPTQRLFTTQVSTRAVRPQPVAWHGVDLPIHTEVEASLAGFHYLRTRNPERATSAFKKLAKSAMAEEIINICTNLQKLMKDEAWLDKTENFFKVEKKPEKPKRGETWDALTEFKAILDEAWLYKRCERQSPNRTVLRTSVHERLDKLSTKSYKLEEGALIRALAESWASPLDSWFDTSEEPLRAKKIDNPFKKLNEPLDPNSALLVGRKDQLEELKSGSANVQPILLYGQAKSGKTSLIERLQKQEKNFWPPFVVNLRSLNQLTHISLEVLQLVGQHLQSHSNLPAPVISASVAHTPEVLTRYKDYLFQVCRIDPTRKVTIVIDQMERAVTIGREGRHELSLLIGLLSNMPQQVNNLNIIYSGRLTPREFNALSADKANVKPIELKAKLVDEKAVATLLNQPLESLIARFQPDAVSYIHGVTGGQPYLVQLLAQQVINRFNDREKKKEEHPDPVFVLADVDAVTGFSIINGESFLDRDKMNELPFWKSFQEYYQMLLEQANRRLPEANNLLAFLAKDPTGRSFEELYEGFGRRFGLDSATLREQLDELVEMDLVALKKENNRWKIAIELIQIYILAQRQVEGEG